MVIASFPLQTCSNVHVPHDPRLSIAYPTRTRGRRAKTNRIDGEALLRALLAYKRGEPRVCAMVKVPAPEEEDRRHLCRERKVLIASLLTMTPRTIYPKIGNC
jgi:hypothetical protein